MTEVPIRANQWTGFYMIETFVMKELNVNKSESKPEETPRINHSLSTYAKFPKTLALLIP